MATAGLRELRQNASELVRRVEAGERIEITVQGRVVAELVPAKRRQWRRWDEIQGLFSGPADAQWEEDMRRAGEFIDDEPVDPFERHGS